MMNDSLFTLADQFVAYKRQNGRVYQTGAYYLEKYIQFASETNPEITVPDRKSVQGFLEKYEDAPGSLYNAAAFLREFSRYLIARGYPDAYLIPAGRTRLPTPVPPYFFTGEEISAFFRECDSIRDDPHHKGRHLALPAMFRLLYCCGLRCKEARVLARKDVHLDKGYFDVLQSKGPKSRRIYISGELTEYLDGYDRQISRLFPDRRIFFPSRAESPYGAAMLENNFLRFWYSAFPEKKDSGVSIRAYDFRYPNLNKIQTFWMKYGNYNKYRLKRFGFYFYLLFLIPQKSTREPSGFFHFAHTFLSFSSSRVASAFAFSSAMMSR